MSSKQREALSDACYAMFNFLKTHYGSCYEEMANALDKAKAALAEPVLNYEVGTAREQNLRFENFCYRHRSYEKGCGDCPLLDCEPCCELAWAHLPYGKEVQNG
jgi:hypothetical protein